MDVKLSQFQSIALKKVKQIVEYSNRLQELVGELDSAVHVVSDSEQKPVHLCELPGDFNVTAETIIDGKRSNAIPV